MGIKLYHRECAFCNSFFKTDEEGYPLDSDDMIIEGELPLLIYKTHKGTHSAICVDCQEGIRLVMKRKK